MTQVDWQWKLREVIERVRTRYEHIGRKTGAPFLAVLYPTEEEAAVRKEWQALLGMLESEFEVITVDLLSVTMTVIDGFGVQHIVDAIDNPMPGSNPQEELGRMWISAATESVRQAIQQPGHKRPVIILENITALFPAATPRAVMQALWDHERFSLDGPVVVFIPGTLVEPRVYAFLDREEELMYRGDIL
jgi:hypothetical protein